MIIRMTTVYIGMTMDILHHGHINILSEARKHGEVIVGLLTDRAIAEHKRLPYLNWDKRRVIVANIVGVSEVVEQDEWDYAPNLLKHRPDIMIHGTDWLDGPLAPYREKAVAALQTYGGKLIEVPYTHGVSSGEIQDALAKFGTTPDMRRKSLKRLLAAKPISRFIEAHNPISALIAENVSVTHEDRRKEFDGFWSSSLVDSTIRGKPDTESLDIDTRLANINEIFDVTTKPLVFDLDTGGKIEHLQGRIKSIERLGISAVIIEDKKGLKKNSLLGNDVAQEQEDMEIFCDKIRAARAGRVSEDFMVIARVESLVLDRGMEDALCRAEAYTQAGADGIMIHSKKSTADEVLNFAAQFRKNNPSIPLVVVPTSFHSVPIETLAEAGFNIVIYANQLLRAAYPAMSKVAESILTQGNTSEIESDLMPIVDILDLIPGTRE